MQWFPLLFARFSIGLFFCISGYHKLFVPASKQLLLETLKHAGIPFLHFNLIFVPAVEFIGGGLLALGLFSTLSSFLLICIVTVAAITDATHKIPSNLSLFSWISHLLYLPEPLYFILLTWFIIEGPGKVSFDYKLQGVWKKWFGKHL